jgi:hypothetical protein
MRHEALTTEKSDIQPIRPRMAWGFVILCTLLCDAGPALAIQTHGPPEGLYAHQIAHLGFLVAMVYIWFRTRHREGEGWRLIRLSFVFFAVWNINTFITHSVSVTLDPAKFQGYMGPLPKYFVARSVIDIYFFLGKMDHFLCIPAALCLGLGLQKMRRAVAQHLPSDDVY